MKHLKGVLGLLCSDVAILGGIVTFLALAYLTHSHLYVRNRLLLFKECLGSGNHPAVCEQRFLWTVKSQDTAYFMLSNALEYVSADTVDYILETYGYTAFEAPGESREAQIWVSESAIVMRSTLVAFSHNGVLYKLDSEGKIAAIYYMNEEITEDDFSFSVLEKIGYQYMPPLFR